MGVMRQRARGTPVMALLLIFTAAGPLWSQEPADERLVAAIEVEGLAAIAPEVVRSEITRLQVGQAFTEAAAEEDRRSILKLGWFESVRYQVQDVPGGVRVTFVCQERRRITKIVIVGNTVVPDEDILNAIVTRVGSFADPVQIRNDVARIRELYADRGYDAIVTSAGVDRFGVWTIHISERKIRSVDVKGLKKTRRHVVTRELRLKPGELFYEPKVRRNLERVQNLQIFEQVSWDVQDDEQNPEEYVKLVLNVKEKRTGFASLGGGWSNLDGLIGFVTFSENNLFGEAQRVGAELQFGGRTSYSLSYANPWLDSHHTGLSMNVFNTERRREFVGGGQFIPGRRGGLFEERRRGGSLTVSRPVSGDVLALIGFRVETISDAFFQASRSIGTIGGGVGATGVSPRQGGLPGEGPDAPTPPGDLPGPVVVAAPLHRGGEVRSVTLTGLRDTRNLINNPTRGDYQLVSIESAGEFLGGGADFRKFTGEARKYVKISKKKNRVVAGRVRAATATGNLPLFEAFIVGGTYTLRGYQEDRFWGKSMLLINLEFREPVTDRLQGIAFVDAGSAWGGSFPTTLPGLVVEAPDRDFGLHPSVGVGLRVDTPIGPLGFDWGTGEDGSQFHFRIGQLF